MIGGHFVGLVVSRQKVSFLLSFLLAITLLEVLPVGNASPAVAAQATPSFVQSAAASANASSTTLAKAFTASNAGGNAIVVAVVWDGAAAFGCTDSRSNVYSVAITHKDVEHGHSLGVCYATNIASGSNTVTVTFSSSSPYRRIAIHEYSGISSTAVVDTAIASNGQASTAVDSVSAGVATANSSGDLIFGAATDAEAYTSINAGTGFSQRAFTNNKDLATQDKILATAGYVSSTQTFGDSDNYVAVMVAFRAAGAALPAGINFIQSTTATNNNGGTSLAKAFVTPNTAGNAIVAAISWDGTSSISCSDSKSNVYSIAIVRRDVANNQTVGICYAANIAAGSNTFTVNFSASATYRHLGIHEYSGLATNSVVDVVSSNSGIATTSPDVVTSNSANTVTPGDLIFGAGADTEGYTSINAGSGFTQRASTDNKSLATQDKILATAGSVSSTQTFGNEHDYVAVMVAFRPAGSTPPAGVNFVQSATATNNNGGTSLTKGFSFANTAENAIVVAVSWNGAGSLSCSDSKSNLYTVELTKRDVPNNQTVAVCYAINIAAGVNTFTATFSASATYRRIAIHEYSGLATSAAVDVSVSVNGLASTGQNAVSSGSVTTTSPGDLIFGVTADTQGTTGISAGVGFSPRAFINNQDIVTQDQIQSSVGASSSIMTFAEEHHYVALLVAFRPANALPTPGAHFVQAAKKTTDSNSPSINSEFVRPNAAGNTIIAAVSWGLHGSLTGCSDTKGNIYSVAVTKYDPTNDQSIGICFATNITAGSNTITATFSQQANYRRIAIHEYSGIVQSNALDGVASNSGTATTAVDAVAAGPVSTTVNGDLIFGAAMDDFGFTSIAPGTGYSQRVSVNNQDLVTQDQIQTSAGPISSTQTFQDSHGFIAALAAFKVATSPTASYSATPQNGSHSLTVDFDANSSIAGTSSISNYQWNFGDGQTATGQTASHVYANPGTYITTLVVANSVNLTDVETHDVTVFAAPVAGFTYSPSEPSAFSPVSFDASSSSAPSPATIANYAWSFGDNSTATGPAPSHTFTTAGTFSVSLIVTDSNANTAAISQEVVVIPAAVSPIAAFSVNTVNGATPLDITVDASASDAGSGNISNYAWDFGDTQTGFGLSTSHSYSAPGIYTVTLTVTNSAALTDSETHDVTVFAAPVAAVSANPTTGVVPLPVDFNSSTSTAPSPAIILSYTWDFGDGNVGSGISPSHTYQSAGTYVASVTITDSNGNTDFETVSIVASASGGGGDEPPVLNPPPLETDEATAPTTAELVSFLFEGNNPIQTGVDVTKIDDNRVGVIGGRVFNTGGNALTNVLIRVKDHPEFGETRSRADGQFDMAVNGGGSLIFVYVKDGYLTLQRQSEIDWNGSARIDDAVMIQVDAQETQVDFSDIPADDFAIAQSSVTTDDDGSRKSTLAIPSGTQAELVLPNGDVQAVDQLNIRATEYTVGEDGPQRMPADLPPSSGYTYAVELSADEAIAAGAKTVQFSQPIYNYVDNFIGFPVGTPVPAGYYDADKAAWIASDNGIIIKIVGITSGVADIDVTGDGIADTGTVLSDLNITDAERTKLSTIYSVGAELWRVPITHFTPWDYNWPYGPPEDAIGPEGEPIGGIGNDDNGCQRSGSVIDCEARTIGEVVPIDGTPESLIYDSKRVPGHVSGRTVKIPLTGEIIPASLQKVKLKICLPGGCKELEFEPSPLLSYTYIWDGKDGFGRSMFNLVSATFEVSYQYPAIYRAPEMFARSFGSLGSASLLGSRATLTIDAVTTHRVELQPVLPTPANADIGGWYLQGHHYYDRENSLLFTDDGRVVSTGSVINTLFGGGSGPNTLPNQARNLNLNQGNRDIIDVVTDSKGTIYVSVSSQAPVGSATSIIYRVKPDGVTDAYVSDPASPQLVTTEGALAVDARTDHSYLAVDASDRLYFSYFGTVRRVNFDATVTTVAGELNASGADTGDGLSPTEAHFAQIRGLKFDASGNLFVVTVVNSPLQTSNVRKVGTNGVVSHIAGTYPGVIPPPVLFGGSARDMFFGFINDIETDPQGNAYLAVDGLVVKVDTSGTVTKIAGGGLTLPNQTNVALEARFLPEAIVFDKAGKLLIDASASGPNSAVIWSLDLATGEYVRFAGDGSSGGPTSNADQILDRGPATKAHLGRPAFALATLPSGEVLIGDLLRRVRVITRGFDTPLNGGLYKVPAPDGTSIYIFDASGRQLETREVLTNALIRSFSYDSQGRVASVADGDGNTTVFGWHSNGNLTVTGPYGKTAELVVGANGYLSSVTNAAGEAYQFGFGNSGLITSFTDPRGGQSTMTYNADGELIQENQPGQGSVTLAESGTADDHTSTHTTAEGRVTTYRTQQLTNGIIRRTVTDPTGASTVTDYDKNGVTKTTDATGMVSTISSKTDPRFGMSSPIPASITNTSPGGKTTAITFARSVVLNDPVNSFSLATQTDTTTANGKVSTRTYNAAANTITETSPDGHRVITALDSHGRAVLVQRDGLEQVAYAYDTRGRLIQTTFGAGPDARVTTVTYGTDGLIATITNPAGQVTSYNQRDAAGRLLSVTSPGNRTISYAYASGGELEGITPPSRPTHTMEYNDRGLVADYHAPLGANWSYDYNNDGALSQTNRPGVIHTASTYDAVGRLSNLNLGATSVNYGYDPQNRLVTLQTSDNVNTTLGYDGTLSTSESITGPFSSSISRSFDNFWRVTSDQVSGSSSINYTYTNEGQLSAVGGLSLVRNASTGGIDSASVGSLTESVAYDSFGQLDTYAVNNGSTVIYSVDLDHDKLGRVTKSVELAPANKTTEYSYDASNRLSSVTVDGNLSASYTYDDNGNRLTRSADAITESGATNDRDQLTSYNGSTFSYLPSGERSSKTTGSDVTGYSYDTGGTLRSVDLPGTTNDIEYVIDAQGRRVGKKVAGSLVQGFLYEGPIHPVAELNSSGNVVSRFVFGTNPNVPDLIVKGPDTYRVVTDERGSIRSVVNAQTGSVAQQLEYDEYGRVLQDTNPGFQPFGFAGGIQDSDTGLTHFGVRDYDPSTGTWITQDPIGLSGGDTNLYAYAANDPINRIDSSGLFWDIIADLGFISYDIGDLIGNAIVGCDLWTSWTALGLDALGAAIPFATGLGPAYRAEKALERSLKSGKGKTTILGEDMQRRVTPYAEATGNRTLGFGTDKATWAEMTPRERWKLNDGQLRKRINEGDSFDFIGRDPDPDLFRWADRREFDLTGSEVLRLKDRGVPYRTIPGGQVRGAIGRE